MMVICDRSARLLAVQAGADVDNCYHHLFPDVFQFKVRCLGLLILMCLRNTSF